MHRQLGIPMWHDGCVVTTAISPGDSVINVDTTNYMEYETYKELIIVGGFITDDWEDYEPIAVLSFTDTTITIEDNVQDSWPVGSMIFPVLPARIEMTQELTIPTDRYNRFSLIAKETFEQTSTTTTTIITTTTSTTTTTTSEVERWGENTADDYNTRSEDTWILAISPNANQGSDTVIRVGRLAGAATRVLLRFTPNQDIAGAVVTSAQLFLYAHSSSGTHQLSAYRVLQDWVEAEISWNDYATATSWNTAGCDSASDVTGEDSSADRRATAMDVLSGVVSVGDTWLSFDVTDIVQDWLDSSASEYGVIIVSDQEGGGTNNIIFRSSEHATDGTRPYLKIRYTMPVTTTTTTV